MLTPWENEYMLDPLWACSCVLSLVLSFPRVLLSCFLFPVCSHSFDSSLQKSACGWQYYWAFLGPDICLQSRASHWLCITQCDQNQWGHLNIYTSRNYLWLYQAVRILIFIDALDAPASLLNSEPLRAWLTVMHTTVCCLITQGHPPI